MDRFKEFETVDGSRGHLKIRGLVSGVLPWGCDIRPAPRVKLPFESVRDKYGYPSLYFRKTERRLHKTYAEFYDKVTKFITSSETILNDFYPFLSSYDKEVVLPTTSALSYVPTTHFDLDEKGVFGHSRSFRFPPEILDFIASKRAEGVNRSDPSLSLKRGTNLGWPTQKSNSGRLERDALLALHVALAIGAKSRGYNLSSVTSFLSSYHGGPFAVAGERLQHTDRVLPFFLADASGFGWHVQPRVRGIYFSPKYCVAWNRAVVKRYLHSMMKDPIHTQDRAQLRQWFSKFSTEEYFAFSIDVSRFDQSVGGDAGREILRVIAAAVTSSASPSRLNPEGQRVYEDLDHEFSMPCLIRTSKDLYISNGAEILSSGLSSTSLIGSTYSEALVYFLASHVFGSFQQAVKAEGVDWSALTWGDDIVFAVRKRKFPFVWSDTGNLISDVDSMLAEFSRSVELDFTQEPTLKFLGQNYSMLSYGDASTGYPLGRFIQQQFFPERLKIGPAQIVGLVARNLMLDSSLQKLVYERTMKMKELAHVDDYVPWSDRMTACEKAVLDISRGADLVSGVDDILNVFTHGLEPDDVLDGMLPEGADLFAELLAQNSVDVSDPESFLRESGFRSSRILMLVKSLSKGDLLAWYRAVQEIQRTFGGSLNRNDSYY